MSTDPCMTTLLRGSLSLNPHIILCIVSLIPGSTHRNVSPEGIKRAQHERWVKCLKIYQSVAGPTCMTTLLRGSLSLNPHLIVCIVSLIPGSTHLNVSPEGIKRAQHERWVKCSKICQSVAGPMYDNTFEGAHLGDLMRL